MATTSDRLGKHAREVKDDLQEMGETVKGVAEEQLAQIGEKASEYLEEGRDKVHGLACACEQVVRQRPLRAVMVAAGIGWLVGHFWKRG